MVAVDVAPDIVRAASRKYPDVTAFASDVRCLPFADSTFDAVVSISTLDHFDGAGDIDLALAELRRVLRPRGTLILTLDNGANPVVALRNLLPYHLTHALGLVPYPTGKTLTAGRAKRALRKCGFDIREVTHIMHAPRVAAVPIMESLRGVNAERADAVLRMAMKFEALRRFPTRGITGHFVAFRAVRR